MKCDDCGEPFDPEKGNRALSVCLECEGSYLPCIACGRQVLVTYGEFVGGNKVICETCQDPGDDFVILPGLGLSIPL